MEGFQQKKGINHIEIFPLIVKLTTIKLVLRIVAAKNLNLEYLDVKNIFFHDNLEGDIYIVQLESFQFSGEKNYVYKLKKIYMT